MYVCVCVFFSRSWGYLPLDSHVGHFHRQLSALAGSAESAKQRGQTLGNLIKKENYKN